MLIESLMSEIALKNPFNKWENVQVTTSMVHASAVHYACNLCLCPLITPPYILTPCKIVTNEINELLLMHLNYAFL